MTRRNPFEELEHLFERMSRQVETGDWAALTSEAVAVDLVDVGGSYELAADLPGYDRDDIDITLTGDTLQIEATRRSTEEEVDGRYLRRERHERTVSRSVRLPEPVDEEGASATYRNGVLEVRFPKADPAEEGRSIDID